MGDEWMKWLTPVGGGGLLYFCWKFIFPMMKTSWQAQAANNASYTNMVTVLQAENATFRAQLAAYSQMAEEMKLIKYQLEQANQKIADQSILIEQLTAEIHLLKGLK